MTLHYHWPRRSSALSATLAGLSLAQLAFITVITVLGVAVEGAAFFFNLFGFPSSS